MDKEKQSLRARLLERLLAAGETPLSGEALSTELGVTRAAVWKEIQLLRREGYRVEAATNRGYRLGELPDLLTQPLVYSALPPGADNNLLCLETVDSTNLHLNRLALAGAGDGTVVLADSQTSGAGRLGRSFSSPSGVGIYLSILLEPRCGREELGLLTSYAGLAVCHILEQQCGLSPEIKWPNDIILGGKKVCGILTRLVTDGETNTITHAIVGIGINVGQEAFSEELAEKAISIYQATGRRFPRARLAGALIEELNRIFRRECWLEQPPQAALAELTARSCTLGRRVSVISPAQTREGEAVELDRFGGLVVRFAQGTETVSSGEVSVRGVLGYT